jgi:RecB family exonuclease
VIQILLGRTRTLRAQALGEMGFEVHDPFGRRERLHLVSTPQHKALLLEQAREPGSFAPLVFTLQEWCRALWDRFGDGRAVLPDEVVALSARRLVDRHVGRWPMLASVPDRLAVSRELARLEARAGAFRTPPTHAEAADALETLRLVLDASGTEIRWSVAMEGLLARLAQPQTALQRLLRQYPAVVMDDLVGSTPLEAELVVTACKAFVQAGAQVAITLSSGRDRGGLEAGLLLGWEPPSDREPRVFAATQHLRRAIFSLVETGEARVVVASERGLAEIEEWAETGPGAERDLADAYADGLPVSAESLQDLRDNLGPVRVINPQDPGVEARFVASAVHDALLAGAAPEDCAVALGDDTFAEDMLAALRDIGVPARLVRGRPLSTVPLGWAVSTLAGQALDGFTPDGLCGLADFVGWPFAEPVQPQTREGELYWGSPPQQVRLWCEAARIRAGRPRAWQLGSWAIRTRAVDGPVWKAAIQRMDSLAALLLPLAEDRTPSAWREALGVVFRSLRLEERALEDEASSRAWSALQRGLDRLVLELELAHGGVWPAYALREILDDALGRITFDPLPPHVHAVPVMPVTELWGCAATRLFVTGLVRGAFPATPPPAILGETPIEPTQEARFLLASLLREAMEGQTVRELLLSWPASLGGAAVGPSLLLAELLDLPTLLPSSQGTSLGDLVVDRISELALHPARRTDRLASAALSEVWRQTLPPAERHLVDTQLLAISERRGVLGHRDGLLQKPLPRPTGITVTALETYTRCPARYWYTYELGLAPPDRVAPELEPRRRGTALHRILEYFLKGRDMAPLSGEKDPEGARHALFEAATRVLDELEEEGGFDPLFQGYARRRWTAGLVDDAPAGILRVWLDAEIAGPMSQPEAVEQRHDGLQVGPVLLRGVLDRVDRYPSGVRLVTDYKTGTPPPRSWIESGFTLQPIAYSAMVAVATGAPVAASFLSLARPDELRRTAFIGDAAALDQVCTPSERRRAVVLDEGKRQELLDRAAVAAQALVEARFPPSPHGQDVAGCPVCAFRRICRLDPHRHGLQPPEPPR